MVVYLIFVPKPITISIVCKSCKRLKIIKQRGKTMKNNLRITGLFITVLLFVSLLAGCGHSHTWTEASCTAAKTCNDCGESEGEALGHSWTDASCTAAKTCVRCGETNGTPLDHQFSDATCSEAAMCQLCGLVDGEPLEHLLTEATYQSPAICTVCGSSVGDALEADFDRYGIKADMELGKSYEYHTVCDDETTPITGSTEIISYEVIDSNDDLPARDNYQWHIVRFKTTFTDSIIRTQGFKVDYTYTDYYNIRLFTDEADHSDPIFSACTVNYNGVDTPVYFSQSGNFEENSDGSVAMELTFYVQKPLGYQGIVVGLNNAKISTRNGNYLFDVYDEENFLLFRLNN